MESLWRDLRFAVRLTVRHRNISLTAALALALGVGLTTTMFSILNGAFLRGLPFEDPDELMVLRQTDPSAGVGVPRGVSLHDLADWRRQQTSFEDLGAFYPGTVNVSGAEGRPERCPGAFVTANVFDLLRARPVLGRGFQPGDDGPAAEPVVLIGHGLWRDRFGGDPSVVGRSLRANGETATIVGVMPEGFAFPSRNHIWLPLRLDPLAIERGKGQPVLVVGRLRDGTGAPQAEAEMAGIAKRLERDFPETNTRVGVLVEPYIHVFMPYEQRAGMVTMLGAVFGVLLIACANVANLLLSQAASRAKEIAVRSALGAGRGRLIAQMLTEAGVIAVTGALAGLGIAQAGIGLFDRAVADNPPPFWMDFGIDASVVGFVLALALLATLLSGLAPALRATGVKTNDALKDQARGLSSLRVGRLSQGLVVAEVALSAALLLVSGLMILTIVGLGQRKFDFATRDVLTARVALFESDYPDEPSRLRFAEEMTGRLKGRPGVASVAAVSDLPGMGGRTVGLTVEGRPPSAEPHLPRVRWAAVAPGSFETFRVGVLRGRDLLGSDGMQAPRVALVNRSLAERFFPGEDPVGRRVSVEVSPGERRSLSVVGLVPDLMTAGGPLEERPEGLYVPLAQSPTQFLGIAVRTDGDPLALVPMVREAVAALDPDLPVYGVSTLEAAIAERTWFVGVFGGLFVVFGIAALALAGVGLFAVMSFDVGRRRQEFGIRMSLGAQAGDVLRLVFRQGSVQLLLGLGIGLGLGMGLGRLVEGLFYDVAPWDPVAIAGVVAGIVATGLLAFGIPGLRAARVDPAVALRHE